MRIAASIAQIDNHCSVPHSVTYVGIELLGQLKIILFLLPQVLDQDKEKMQKVEESNSKNGRLFGLVMARGRCWTGTWKRALEITGFLVDQGIKDQTFWEL